MPDAVAAAPRSATACFAGQVAIVTGAGAGLGRAYALHLARLGARVLVNNRRRVVDADGLSSAERVAAEIRADGGEALVNEDPVEDPASGVRMVAQALAAWGRLDAVVANAGVSQAKSFHALPLDEFRRIFDVNFWGNVHVAHAAYAHMREARYGRLVLTSSSGGLYGVHGLTAYAAAKAAVVGLVRALAIEGRSRDVLVNAVAPYATTAMTGSAAPPAFRERMAPERVAPLVAYLASNQSRLSGEVLIAGGGRVRRAAVVEGRGGPFADPSGCPSPGVERELDAALAMDGARSFPDALAETQDFLESL